MSLGNGIPMVPHRKKPWIQGLSEFRLTRAGLRSLGTRAVTVDVTIGLPPFIYPSKALLRQLIAKAPSTRAALVRDWRRREFERLRRELGSLKGETLWLSRAPIGLRLTVPARSVTALFTLRHAESVVIRNVRGRRRFVEARPRKRRLYAVRARLAYQQEGQSRGLQLCEDRVTVLSARSEKEATRRVEQLLRKQGHTSLMKSGHFQRWAFEEILDVIELIDETFLAGGTEVYYEYKNRRVRRPWKPVA